MNVLSKYRKVFMAYLKMILILTLILINGCSNTKQNFIGKTRDDVLKYASIHKNSYENVKCKSGKLIKIPVFVIEYTYNDNITNYYISGSFKNALKAKNNKYLMSSRYWNLYCKTSNFLFSNYYYIRLDFKNDIVVREHEFHRD
jgi:hypothetical protein